jgi:hypothetical protein
VAADNGDQKNSQGRQRQIHLVPPSAQWGPPEEAGRELLRIILAVKARRDEGRVQAA